MRFALTTLLFLPLSIYAKDLGHIGVVYPIAETDFVQMAQDTLSHKIKTGEWARWQSEHLAMARSSADRPIPVPGLHATQTARQWLVDPSFIVPRDVRDTSGHLLFSAGSRVNPLTRWYWTKTLILFDGDDREQVAWVEKFNQQIKGHDVLILVNGSTHETASHFPHQHIYFDQSGRLVQRLKITQTPATVSLAGESLKITEVKL